MTVLTPKCAGHFIDKSRLGYRLDDFATLEDPRGAMFSGDEIDMLYFPRGDGTFVDRSFSYGVNNPGDGRAAIAADLNNDGFEDLILRQLQDPRLEIYLGRPNGNHWIQFLCESREKFRPAVETRVRLLEPVLSGVQMIAAGSGHFSQQPECLHFGLGGRKQAVTAEVTWPSGRSELFSGLAVDSQYRLVEEGGARRLDPPRFFHPPVHHGLPSWLAFSEGTWLCLVRNSAAETPPEVQNWLALARGTGIEKRVAILDLASRTIFPINSPGRVATLTPRVAAFLFGGAPTCRPSLQIFSPSRGFFHHLPLPLTPGQWAALLRLLG